MLFNSLKLRLLCMAAAVAASCPLVAQRDAASLEGRVVDSSSAVVAGAQVTATNTATNFRYQTQSDSSGAWVISPVRIGNYKVSITAQGFKEAVAGPITLDVQQRQRVDVMLELGDVHERVEVRDSAPLLETDSSETGQVVDSASMVAFPLNGRNPVQLAQLTVASPQASPVRAIQVAMVSAPTARVRSTTTSSSTASTTTPTSPTCSMKPIML